MTNQQFDQTILPLGEKMYRLALAIVGSRDEAQDVAQDVMERLWRGHSELRLDNAEAFVMRSVRNASLDRIKQSQRRAQRLAEVAWIADRSAPPREEFDVGSLIDQFIAELPEQQQTILHLRDVEGYEFDTIAEVVGMESATVRVNLSRARRAIKEKILKTMNFGL